LSPLEGAVRGDSSGDSRVTDHAARGDTDVTQTVQEPSKEPSSSSRSVTTLSSAGGGSAASTRDDPLEVLPASVRNHPSIVSPCADPPRARPRSAWLVTSRDPRAARRHRNRRRTRRRRHDKAGRPRKPRSTGPATAAPELVWRMRPPNPHARGRQQRQSPVSLPSLPPAARSSQRRAVEQSRSAWPT
jgi:hypothetical protein